MLLSDLRGLILSSQKDIFVFRIQKYEYSKGFMSVASFIWADIFQLFKKLSTFRPLAMNPRNLMDWNYVNSLTSLTQGS